MQHASLSRDLRFSIVFPPQDVVSGLFKGDRRSGKAVQDWRSGHVPHEPSFSSGFCEHEEATSCTTRLLLLAFELVSRANKSENEASESLTSCILVFVLPGTRQGSLQHRSGHYEVQRAHLGQVLSPSQLRLSVFKQSLQWYPS